MKALVISTQVGSQSDIIQARQRIQNTKTIQQRKYLTRRWHSQQKNYLYPLLGDDFREALKEDNVPPYMCEIDECITVEELELIKKSSNVYAFCLETGKEL